MGNEGKIEEKVKTKDVMKMGQEKVGGKRVRRRGNVMKKRQEMERKSKWGIKRE